MNRRIAGYDFARSLAVFGLVVANFSGNVGHADFHWLHTFIQSGATATFILLVGVGVSLLTQSVRTTNGTHGTANSRKRLIKRAAFLIVVGICCNLIWYADVLHLYGISIAIGSLLIAPNRWLWSLAFISVLTCAAFIFFLFDYYEVVDEAIRNNWNAPSDSNPWTVQGIVFRFYLGGLHSIFKWIAFLLIGMWLGRWNAHNPETRRRVFFGGIAVALILESIPLLLVHHMLWLVSGLSPANALRLIEAVRILLTPLLTPIYFFAGCGTAITIVGGSLMLTEKYPDAKWTRPFVATGQLALTLYIAHLIVGRGILEGLGLLENQTFPFAIGSAVIFCICAVMFSHFWRKRFDRGPLEWGMRRVTG